jgi:hypothetical protein
MKLASVVLLLAVFSLAATGTSNTAEFVGLNPVFEPTEPDKMFDGVMYVGNKAIVLMQPRLVAAGKAEELGWFGAGKYLMAVTQESTMSSGQFASILKGETVDPASLAQKKVIVWNSQTGSLQTILNVKPGADEILGTSVLFGTSIAVVIVATPKPDEIDPATGARIQHRGQYDQRLILFDPARSRTMTFPIFGTAGVALGTKCFTVQTGTSTLKLVTENSQKDVRLPDGFEPEQILWSKGEVFWISGEQTTESGGKKQKRFLLTVQGQVAETQERYRGPADSAMAEIRPADTLYAATAEKHKYDKYPTALNSWWLSVRGADPQNRVLISPNASLAVVAPTNDKVAYTSDGAVFVREISVLGKEVVAGRLKKAVTEAASFASKQVALSIMQYVQDYDETYPPADTENTPTADRLEPYMKQPIAGWVYTYHDGTLADLESPAEVPIGYLQFQYGYYIIYADGHVKYSETMP